MEINFNKKVCSGRLGKIESFKGNNEPPKPIETETSNLPQINSMPANCMNVEMPMPYTKINEVKLPYSDVKATVYRLANGQTVVLAPKKGETEICTYVKCGSINEPDEKRGISHYIEHNLFNGSKNIGPKEFFKAVNKMGAYTNAYTSYTGTSYLIKSRLFDSDDLKKIVELHSDMVQNPKFEQSQLDKEKGVVNSELTMYDDDNSSALLGVAIKQLFQIKSTSGDLTGGRVENINGITRDDVVSYYNQNYTPDKMITVLTGDFNPDEAIELISKSFTKPLTIQKPQLHEELKPIEQSKRIDYSTSKINSDEFAIALKGPENSNLKDSLAVEILLNILSGRKHAPLRKNLEKFNVINPMVSIDRIGNKQNSPQMISIAGQSNPNDTEKVLETVYKSIHDLKSTNLEEDLNISKKGYIKDFLTLSESTTGINSFLGTFLKYHQSADIENYIKTIDSITEKDLKDCLNKYFDLNKVSIVVSHPEKTDKKQVSFGSKLKIEGLNLNEFKYAKLQNNANVYLHENSSLMKSFALLLKSDLPANVNPFIPIALDKLLEKGPLNTDENDFSNDLGKRNISLNFSVNKSSISFASTALGDDINYALDKTIELFNSPKITQEKLDEVKKQLKKNINEKKKSSDAYIKEVMFPDEKTVSTKEAALKAVDELTLGDIQGFLLYIKQHSSAYFTWNKTDVPYNLNNLGMFKPAQKTELRTYKPLEKDVLKVQDGTSGQAEISQVFKFPYDDSPKGIVKLQLMNSILGGSSDSRLFSDLREKQKLAYWTKSNISNYGNTGLINLKIGTTTDNEQDKTATPQNITKSLDGFKQNIQRMKTELVSEEELNAAKLSLKAHYLSETDTSSSKMLSLLNNVSTKQDADFYNKCLKEIDNITAQDILEMSQKVFAGKSLTSIVATQKTLDALNLQQSQ